MAAVRTILTFGGGLLPEKWLKARPSALRLVTTGR